MNSSDSMTSLGFVKIEVSIDLDAGRLVWSAQRLNGTATQVIGRGSWPRATDHDLVGLFGHLREEVRRLRS